MKKIACKALGNPNGPIIECDHVFSPNTFDELVQQTGDHIRNTATHDKELTAMEMASDEQKQQWLGLAKKIWDAQPDE